MGVSRGAEAFRRNALEAVSGGATVLKMIASGAVLAMGGVPGSPEMTPEEIAAVVEVGHAAGIKVTAHAHGAQSIKDAILAGVDSIEHASLADDEAIALAAEHDVAFSMDIYNGTHIAVAGREQAGLKNFSARTTRRSKRSARYSRKLMRQACQLSMALTPAYIHTATTASSSESRSSAA